MSDGAKEGVSHLTAALPAAPLTVTFVQAADHPA